MEMEVEIPLNCPLPSGEIELRLLIQSKTVGSVIGKEGQNISRLRNDNLVSIVIHDCPGPERLLTIKGSNDIVLKVLGEVLENQYEILKKNCWTDARVLVHQSQTGSIIGKDGQKIKELRDECGGPIKVYKHCCPQSTDCVIQIIGDRERTCSTIAKILELLKDSPINGVNKPYDPHNFNEFFANIYGGWGEATKGRLNPSMGWDIPTEIIPEDQMEHDFIKHNGPHSSQSTIGHRGPVCSPDRGPNLVKGPPDADFDGLMEFPKGKHSMSGNDTHDGDFPITSKKITIPIGTVGTVIGMGGYRIQKMRSDSGATIRIQNPNSEDPEYAVIISGSDLQIKHAQTLVQQSVCEYIGPKKARYATGIPNMHLKKVSDANTPGAMISQSGHVVVPHLMDYVTNAPSSSGDGCTTEIANSTQTASMGTSSQETFLRLNEPNFNVQENEELSKFNSELLSQAVSFHGHQLLQHLINQYGKRVQELDLNKVDYRTVYQARLPALRKQNVSERNEFLLLIKMKADLIYETKCEVLDSLRPPHPIEYEGYYRVMPPLEYFLDVSADVRKKCFLKSMKRGDLLYGQFLSHRSGKGTIKVLATAGGKHRSILNMDVFAKISNDDIKPNDKDKNIFGFWPCATNLLVEVLHVYDSEGGRSNFDIRVGTKGVTLHPYLNNKVTLGKVTESDTPPILLKMAGKKVNSFNECLQKSENFCNPRSIKYMSKKFSISLIGEYSSLMDSLKCNFRKSECYSSIGMQQYTQWAYSHVTEGVLFYKDGRIEEALNEFRIALSLDHENTEALVARGALFANQGDLVKAVCDFEHALKINPNHSNAKSYICETLLHLGRRHEEDMRYNGACELYIRCLEIDSTFSSAQKALEEV
ncbi:unnamed protein product, partial [Meganyctiphanes norvegica]